MKILPHVCNDFLIKSGWFTNWKIIISNTTRPVRIERELVYEEYQKYQESRRRRIQEELERLKDALL